MTLSTDARPTTSRRPRRPAPSNPSACATVHRDRRGPPLPSRGARRRHARRRGIPHHQPGRPAVGRCRAPAGRTGSGRPARCSASGRSRRAHADEVVVPPGLHRPAVPPVGHAAPRRLPGVRAGLARRRACPTGNTAAEQAQQIGMHHDGMPYFPLARGPQGTEHGPARAQPRVHRRGLPAHRHATSAGYAPAYTAEMVRKSQNAHGVTVAEIERAPIGRVAARCARGATAGSPRTRRWSFSGPAAGHRLRADRGRPARAHRRSAR